MLVIPRNLLLNKLHLESQFLEEISSVGVLVSKKRKKKKKNTINKLFLPSKVV